MAKINLQKYMHAGLITILGTIVFLLGIWIAPINHYVTGVILVISAIALYLYCVFCVADRNWLDIRAVFTGMWLGTVGLAALRLVEYQEQWQNLTWFLFAVSFALFQIGANLGVEFGGRMYEKLKDGVKKLRIGRMRLEMQEGRLFWICIVTTLIGFLCFAINVAIRGFIPCFSDSTTAYTDFYTKFHVFAVAATAVSGLCYYCIMKVKLSNGKKVLLGLCIFYLVFLFPILVVSRGVFMVAAVSLAVCMFYIHRKKLLALILSVVVIFGVYMFASMLRNYSDEYLSVYFEPAQIVVVDKTQTEPENNATMPTSGEDNISADIGMTMIPDEPIESFALSPKQAFLYSYLTVGHDNFNEAVQNVQNYAWGARQLSPFNVILRSQFIKDLGKNAESYFVRPHLNTYNLIGDFYYDFGSIGVVVCILLWSAVFGVMQGFVEKGKGIFALMVLSNAMIPVALCFFSSWTTNFTQWMLWGVTLLAAIVACLNVNKKV